MLFSKQKVCKRHINHLRCYRDVSYAMYDRNEERDHSDKQMLDKLKV